jgi:hypothetical protein
MMMIVRVFAVLCVLGVGLTAGTACGSKSKTPPNATLGGSMTTDMGQGDSNGIACDASQVGLGACTDDSDGDSWLVYCNSDDTIWGVDCTSNNQTCSDDGVNVTCQ